jgi:hypothetical protein
LRGKGVAPRAGPSDSVISRKTLQVEPTAGDVKKYYSKFDVAVLAEMR